MSTKIIANFVYNALPILGAVLALLSMATVHPVRADWRNVPTDKQQINMQVPGMEHWNPGYWKRVSDVSRNEGTAYHTMWRSIEEYGIHAYLTYQTRTRRFYYQTIKDMVNIDLGKDYDPSFEKDTYTYSSKNKKFKYIYFSVKAGSVKRKCVGFGNLSSSKKRSISGYYCISTDEPIDDEIVAKLIDSIDLGSDLD